VRRGPTRARARPRPCRARAAGAGPAGGSAAGGPQRGRSWGPVLGKGPLMQRWRCRGAVRDSTQPEAGAAAPAHPLGVQQVVRARCDDDLGLLLNREVRPAELRVDVVLVQLQDLRGGRLAGFDRAGGVSSGAAQGRRAGGMGIHGRQQQHSPKRQAHNRGSANRAGEEGSCRGVFKKKGGRRAGRGRAGRSAPRYG
jgi:hypothetical protein